MPIDRSSDQTALRRRLGRADRAKLVERPVIVSRAAAVALGDSAEEVVEIAQAPLVDVFELDDALLEEEPREKSRNLTHLTLGFRVPGLGVRILLDDPLGEHDEWMLVERQRLRSCRLGGTRRGRGVGRRRRMFASGAFGRRGRCSRDDNRG
jgi:hypothetical protein